ncbi:MAG: hypothetical protein ACJ75B_00425 [Flavisolibacter sp.]
MKKISVLLLLALVGFAGPAFSQLKGFSIGPYLERDWVKGSMAQTNGNGLGVGVAGDIKIGSHLSLMGSYGYLHFGKNFGEQFSQNINARPLRLGLKFKLPLIYLKMESGTVSFQNGSGSALILSPGLGIRVLGLDLQACYESWLHQSPQSFTSLKVAYHF